MSSSKQGHWLDTMTSRGYWENRPDFADAMRGDGQTLHFHATDAPGEWLARREPDMVVLERTPTRTSRSAAQPPSYCSCSAGVARWTPLPTLELQGDRTLLDRWIDHMDWVTGA